jgi:hypothetical protein
MKSEMISVLSHVQEEVAIQTHNVDIKKQDSIECVLESQKDENESDSSKSGASDS